MPIPLYSIQDLFISKGDEDKLTIKQFDIHRGACYVFEGRMGCGKTTLLDIISGLLYDFSGEIIIDGKKCNFLKNGFKKNLIYLKILK